MNSVYNYTPYKLSESELFDLAHATDEDQIFRLLFHYYPVECINMQILYEKGLDKMVEKLIGGCSDREKLTEKIVETVAYASTGTRQPSPIIFECIKYIRETLEGDMDADISTRELADKYKISHYYLLHQFKNDTGVTVTEYKTRLKMNFAKKLLLETDKSVSEIALESGFGGSSFFSKVFKRRMSVSPTEYRRIMTTEQCRPPMLTPCDDVDRILYSMLPHMTLSDGIDIGSLKKDDSIPTYEVSTPDGKYAFLHEAAIIEYKGMLFTAWYNCRKMELAGETPIRFSRSADGAKTWSEPKVVANDESGRILYCPPVFGIDDGKLYMFVNRMLIRGDHIHSLDLYVYDEARDEFDLLWSRPIPFKLNTNVYRLKNGKLMLPGRIGELDGFPKTPAVLISDSGRIDAEWRIVKIQKDGMLPDGSEYVHPELSAIVFDDRIYIISRNDKRRITTAYVSYDNGETWSQPYAIDLPFASTKIYSGTLEDGRSYIVGSFRPERSKLALFISEKDTPMFREAIMLQDGFSEKLGYGVNWHYPSACEADGKLYIAYTANLDASPLRRSLVVSVVDLK